MRTFHIWKRFRNEEKGGTLAFFAILLPIMIILVGFILDFGRVYVTSQQLQSILDSASLAAANTAITVDDGINDPYAVIPSPEGPSAAKRYFDTNFAKIFNNDVHLVEYKVNPKVGDLNLSDGKIHIQATVRMKLFFGQIIHPNLANIEVTRDSWAQARAVY